MYRDEDVKSADRMIAKGWKHLKTLRTFANITKESDDLDKIFNHNDY